jgi:hypothetical protein
MKKCFAICLAFIGVITMANGQSILEVSDHGWRLWLDRKAEWANDSLYLPGEYALEKLPSNPPTGSWKTLNRKNGIEVSLPSTVEQHFWGVNGYRSYKGEYFYEQEDSSVKNGNYLGVSWWWKEVRIPKTFKNKKVILHIQGARLRAEVYWNTKLVGYHIITETSFECDISDAIKPDEVNTLAIRITNPGGRLDWLDTELMQWGNVKFHKSHGFGGLDRGIVLQAHDPLYLSDTWVLNSPSEGTINAHSRIVNTTASRMAASIRYEILDPSKKNRVCATFKNEVIVAENSTFAHQAQLSFPKAELWSNEHPKLYTLRVTVLSKDQKPRWIDTQTTTFGFRWFEATGIGTNAMLKFNGKRIRLISAISWGFWGINGLWPTRELAAREVKAAKAFGMNAIQFHRNIGKTEMLDAQDRLGLMRYMEPGGGQTSFGEGANLYAPSPKSPVDNSGRGGETKSFSEKYMEEKIVRMVRDHRSHPSLLMYAIQNEIHPDLSNPRVFHILRRIHQEDPSRMVVVKSGFPSGKPSINQAWMMPYSDVVLHDTGDGYSGWWDDHTVGGPGIWRDEMYKNSEDFTHRSVNNKEIVIWGEMLGAAVPDNHSVMIKQIEKLGGKSYDLKDHQELLSAYKQFLERWNFKKAFPTTDALFISIGNKSYDFWGRVIETARLAEANDFFVISGWESTAIENHSGLVDNLRNFKGNPELIRKRLEPLKPVIKTRSLVYLKNSTVIIDLYLLNETHSPHPTRLSLSILSPSKKKATLGTFDVPAFQEARFVYPVTLKLATPPLREAGEYTLQASLSGKGTLVTEENILVVDLDSDALHNRKIGVVSQYPAFTKNLEIVPGISVEPYRSDNAYDVIIAANRFIKPPQASADSTQKIENTDDEPLYRDVHYGQPENFDYTFTGLPSGKARVTLKFVELFQNAEGLRVFDVSINGMVVLKDLDIFKKTGGKFRAYDTTFDAMIPDGVVRIGVPKVSNGSARFAAIKIEAEDRVIAINCGGGSYVDKAGLVWKPYEPEVTLDDKILDRVKKGTPLLVLAEGQIAVQQYGKRLGDAGVFKYLGDVGEVRASWMGSWFFVRKHPVYAGLPVDCGMSSYYQTPVNNSDGMLLEGKNVEVITGYGRDHDRNIGAASFTAKYGKETVLVHTLPGIVSGMSGDSTGIQPIVLKKILLNSLMYLTTKR